MSCRMVTTHLLLIGSLLIGRVAMADQKPRPSIELAGSVPPDARLFLELDHVQSLLKSRAGQEFADLLAGLMPSATTQPTTQPVPRGWEQVLGEKMGLRNGKAAQLLFSGRLALAADDWNDIGDAVLLAEPTDPAALEAALEAQRIPETAQAKVRRYRLAGDHELACDGRMVVTGRQTGPAGLYLRTFALWMNDRRATLADLVDFQERIAALPAGADIVFYNGPGAVPETRPTTRPVDLWPRVQSASIGVVMNGRAVTVETSMRLAEPSEPNGADPPIDALMQVPDSTLIAWTRPIRYAEEFSRIDTTYTDGLVRFYLDMLQTGLPPGKMKKELLDHLVGDTLLMIAYQPFEPPDRDKGERPLLLPVVGLVVETDAPEAVSGTLRHMAGNLLKLLNLQPPEDGPLAIREVPLRPDGPVITSVPLGHFFASQTQCEPLHILELSWTIADGRLVVATHPELIRKIVEVWRGEGQVVAAGGFRQALERVKAHQGTPRMALIARPEAAATVIDSWMAYIARHHPDMLQPDWWARLRREHLAGGVQLGIVPSPTTQPGVLVSRTLAGWPAHKRLLPDDRIVAVDGKELDAKRPLASLRDLMANREQAGSITLRVVRKDKEETVAIPMASNGKEPPPIQPFELLENLADLLRVFSSASYITWQPSPELVSARLELVLVPSAPPATSPAPTTMPATAPATAPASAPATISSPVPATAPAETRPAQTRPATTQPAEPRPAQPTTSPASAPASTPATAPASRPA